MLRCVGGACWVRLLLRRRVFGPNNLVPRLDDSAMTQPCELKATSLMKCAGEDRGWRSQTDGASLDAADVLQVPTSYLHYADSTICARACCFSAWHPDPVPASILRTFKPQVYGFLNACKKQTTDGMDGAVHVRLYAVPKSIGK